MKRESILELMESRDISLEDITDAAFELYEGEEIDEEKAREEFRELIQKYSQNNNVRSLFLAGLLLEEDSRVSFEGDLSILVADELLGINIAEYIGGKKALFNFTRYDRQKPGILSELDTFVDDVVGGLIAGCMTKLFEDDSKC